MRKHLYNITDLCHHTQPHLFPSHIPCPLSELMSKAMRPLLLSRSVQSLDSLAHWLTNSFCPSVKKLFCPHLLQLLGIASYQQQIHESNRYRVFIFTDTLQQIPRIHIVNRSSKLNNILISWPVSGHPIAAPCWRGKCGNIRKILGKKTPCM